MNKARTHLMFQGEADEAIGLYSSIFKDFQVEVTDRYGLRDSLPEGSIKLANVSFLGHEMIIFNSPPVHEFTFTPSTSLIIDFDTEEELKLSFGKLSDGGKGMMPPDNYGFSKCFAWTVDKFGLSWQLNLP